MSSMSRKGIAWTLGILCCTTVSVRAQIISVQTGSVLSWMKASYNPSSEQVWDEWSVKQFPRCFDKPLMGFSIAVTADYLNKSCFFLSSGAGITANGSRGVSLTQNGGEGILESEVRTELLYLTLNTQANFRVVRKEHFFLYLGLGPRVDMLMSKKFPNLGFFTSAEHIQDELNENLFGLTGTLGMRWVAGRVQIGLNLSYQQNLTRLMDYTSSNNTWGAPEESVTYRMNLNYLTSSFSVGYRLGGGSKRK